jgi:acetyl esterase/lipase
MRSLRIFFFTLLLGLLPLCAEETFVAKRTEVIYGRKFGTALTLDVIQPVKPNGFGVCWMISGGFFSSHDGINPDFVRPLLARGYTVFAVVHGSQPKFTIPEITEDIHRAIRFVRHNATSYGVNPDKLGIFGASAGGHLSLTMGTQGKPGPADAKDAVDRESSAVQAVAAFFPPTDFLNWDAPGDDNVGVGRVGSQFKAAFGPRSDTPESRQVLGREISPINFASAKMAPTLILHGTADKLVPFRQAEIFVAKCKEVGATVKLVPREGKDHGWSEMGKDLELFADWYDTYLRGPKS